MGSVLLTCWATWQRRRRGLLLASLVFAALLGSPAFASADTLFGTVSAQTAGHPVAAQAGATVVIVDPQSQATVAFTTTGLDGTYSVTIPAGTYDVRFEANGLAPATVGNIQVQTERKLDVVLVPAGLVRLSGVLRGSGGVLSGVFALLFSSESGALVGEVQTAADGSYSFAVSPGRYELRLSQARGPAWVPLGWEAGLVLDVSEDRSLDVVLPAVPTLTVRVVGEDGSPVVGARVVVPPYVAQASLPGVVEAQFSSSTSESVTDANGEVRVPVFDGSTDPGVGQQVEVTPPAESPFGQQTVPLPTIHGDTTLVVHLPRTVQISGVVRGAGGAVGGVKLYLNSGDGSGVEYGRTVTAPDGSYSFAVAPGHYELRATESGAPSWLPESWEAGLTVDFREDQTLDVVLPAVPTLTVRVVGDDGAPVAGARVIVPPYVAQASLPGAVEAYFASSTSVSHTDEQGEVHVPVFDGSLDPGQGQLVEVTPPAGSVDGRQTAPLPAIHGDTTLVVQLPRAVHVSGVVRGAGGVLSGVPFYLISGDGTGQVLGEGTTGSDGSYSFAVSPGRYELRLSQARGPAWVPLGWEAGLVLDVSEDRSLDVVLPAVPTLTVRVVGEDGSPVVGARVVVPPYVAQASLPGVVEAQFSSSTSESVTDANGEVRVPVFDGSTDPGVGQQVEVTPPAESPFGQQTVPLPTIHGDTTLVVRFGRPDTTAPAVSCDQPPTGWHTAEVSVACTASDAGSGLARAEDAAFSLSTNVGDGHEDAAAQTGTRRVCDIAGNCATAGPVGPIAVDRAAPAIAFTQASDGAGGWWVHTPATVHVTATDLNVSTLSCAIDGVAARLVITSGTTTREADLTVRGEGRHTVSCSAADTLGHAGERAEPVLIDLKAPAAPTLAADRAPDYAATSWYRDAVTVTTTDNGDPALADGSPGSGVDPGSVPAPQTYTTSGSHVTSATVADVAGHVSTVRRLTVKVDADPPTTALTCPGDVAQGARASAHWRDHDGESGLAGTALGSIAVDSSTLGTFTVEHVATDHVGHSASSACAYRVVYPFRLVGGLRAPPIFNAIAGAPAATPVSFSLTGERGLAIFAPGYPQVQPISCADGTPSGSPTAAAAAAPLAYTASNDRYTYSWDASSVAPGSCVALLLGLSDGALHEAWFSG